MTTPTLPPVPRRTGRRVLLALLVSLVPVLLTAVGLGSAQASGVGDREVYLAGAASTTVSALLGLAVATWTRPGASARGLRAPRNLAGVLWCLPPALAVLAVLAGGGVDAPRALVPGFLWLALAAGVAEEVWYRGIVLALLRPLGARPAVATTASVFGVLHLANLAGGASPAYAVLQLGFALVFGIVAAELTVLTGSILPAVVWHVLHDAVSYLGGDALGARDLLALGVATALLAGYAVVLWRRLPR